jgi:hypothetical protein
MLSLELSYLVAKQQHLDRLRNIERQRLLRAARGNQINSLKPYRQAISWLGAQMVKWGTRLQAYATPSPSQAINAKIIR